MADRRQFEPTLVPHREAAYNLARWLTRSHQDAQDVVQEAYLRAYRFFDGFVGDNGRAWLLQIVRNTAYSLLGQRQPLAPLEEVADEPAGSPEATCLKKAEREQVRRCLAELPLEFREVLVLREMEGLSYKEIADVLDVPLGTVMSRLSRGRERLKQALLKEDGHGVS